MNKIEIQKTNLSLLVKNSRTTILKDSYFEIHTRID